MPPSKMSRGSIRLRRFSRRGHVAAFAAALFLAATSWSAGPALAAADDAEARTIFEKFIAAQNAHDADDVKAMLRNSPGTLLFARGIETTGRDAVAARFKGYYEGTWHLEPDMSKFRVAVISNEVMQILVPSSSRAVFPASRPTEYVSDQPDLRAGCERLARRLHPADREHGTEIAGSRMVGECIVRARGEDPGLRFAPSGLHARFAIADCLGLPGRSSRRAPACALWASAWHPSLAIASEGWWARQGSNL